MSDVPYFGGSSEDAALWDRMWLGDILLPGTVKVTVNHAWKYEVGETEGTDGAPTVYKGRAPRSLACTLIVPDQESFDAFVALHKEINAFNTGGVVTPFDVRHPQAQIAGIISVNMTDMVVPSPDSLTPWTITFTLQEHEQPRQAQSSNSPRRGSSPLSGEDDDTAAQAGTRGLAPLPPSRFS